MGCPGRREYPDPRAGTRPVSEQPVDADVFRHEHARVDQGAYVLFGFGEEMLPGLPRNCPAVRVDGDDLALRRGRDLLLVKSTRPDVRLVHTKERGHRVAVPPIGHPSGNDPAFDGLRVHLYGFGQLGGRHSPFQQERSQPLVWHSTQARRT